MNSLESNEISRYRPPNMPEVPRVSSQSGLTATEVLGDFFSQIWNSRIDVLKSASRAQLLQLQPVPVLHTFIPIEELISQSNC